MDNINKMDYLRAWCQQVIPLVYDDSLSYYEFLCKMLKMLNDMITNINNIVDYVEEMSKNLDEKLSLQDNKINALYQAFEDFKEQFGDNLYNEVLKVMNEYLNNGVFDDILKSTVVANIENNDRLESTYTPTLIGGDMSHIKKALTNGSTIQVTFVGDSITVPIDCYAEQNGYPWRYVQYLKSQFPSNNFKFSNRSQGGLGIQDLANPDQKPIGFTWNDGVPADGTPWLDQVKATNPDLLFIAFGFNGQSSAFDGYTALTNVINSVRTLPIPPTIVLINCFGGAKREPGDTGRGSYKWQLIAARYTKIAAKILNVPIYDLMTYYETTMRKIGSGNPVFAHYNQNDFNMPPMEDGYYKFEGANLIPLKVPNYDCYNMMANFAFKLGNPQGLPCMLIRENCQLYINQDGGIVLLYNNSKVLGEGKYKEPFNVGTEYLCNIVIVDNTILIKINGETVVDSKMFIDSVYEAQFHFGSNGGIVLYRYIDYFQESYITVRKVLDDDIIFGEDKGGVVTGIYGGNGNQHPSSVGQALLYDNFIRDFCNTLKFNNLNTRIQTFTPKAVTSISSKQNSNIQMNSENNPVCALQADGSYLTKYIGTYIINWRVQIYAEQAGTITIKTVLSGADQFNIFNVLPGMNSFCMVYTWFFDKNQTIVFNVGNDTDGNINVQNEFQYSTSSIQLIQ